MRRPQVSVRESRVNVTCGRKRFLYVVIAFDLRPLTTAPCASSDSDTSGGAEHRRPGGDPRDGGRIVPICDLGDEEAAAVRRGVAVLRTAGARVLHYTHTRIANYPNGTEKACCECCEDLPYVLSRVDNATRNFPLDGIFTDNAVANEAWRDGYYAAIAARVHRQNRTHDPDTVAATKRWYGMNENCAHGKYPPHMRWSHSPAATDAYTPYPRTGLHTH